MNQLKKGASIGTPLFLGLSYCSTGALTPFSGQNGQEGRNAAGLGKRWPLKPSICGPQRSVR